MKVLFVGMANSIHTVKWIRQVGDMGWDLHLFPSIDSGQVLEGLPSITVHHSVYAKRAKAEPTQGAGSASQGFGAEPLPAPGPATLRLLGIPAFHPKFAAMVRRVLMTATPGYRAWHLATLILAIRPDVIHGMNLQSGGYLVDEARQILAKALPKFRFPPWIASNWGSDIYLFGHLPEHEPRIRSVLEHCDAYFCECQRDVALAHQFGLKARVLPVFPNAGGFDVEALRPLASGTAPSMRKTILVKGYQGVMGRALVALRAVALCRSELEGYQVGIYSYGEEVRVAAVMLRNETGLDIRLLERASYQEMMARYGQARAYIGLSISDAISTSLLEAMTMGTFPIQSATACADEWIVSGRTGFIVPPEDPQAVAAALKVALADDNLVEQAARENMAVVRSRLDARRLKEMAVEIYRSMIEERKR